MRVVPPIPADRWQTENVIVFACPGQGSQTPGFLSPWLELDGVADDLAAYSDAAEVDLVLHGTVSDADTIRDTRIAQPLIVAASLIADKALRDARRTRPGRDRRALGRRVRGRRRAPASSTIRPRCAWSASADAPWPTPPRRRPTGMSAVLGGDEETVLALLADLDLTPANYNGGGQIVAAGALPALAALAEAPVRGSRVIPLQVAGAFHTHYMASAVAALRDAVAGVEPAPTRRSPSGPTRTDPS